MIWGMERIKVGAKAPPVEDTFFFAGDEATMKNKGLLITALALIIVGIIGSVILFAFDATQLTTTASNQNAKQTSALYTSVGQQIFLTGIGSDGTAIPRNATTMSGRTSGSGCASCHGTNGLGGVFRMMGRTVTVPDITYTSLVKEGFTDKTIDQAIRNGKDEEGASLSGVMPRWQMSDTDVAYVITYLKELSEK